MFHSAQFKQILQITVQQHSRCLHHIIAHTPDTNKHPVCTALAATKSLEFTNTACAILTTGAAFKVVCLSIKNQQSSIINCKSSR